MMRLGMHEMTFDKFCEFAGEIFDSLSNEIKKDISISVEENPSEGARILMAAYRLENLYSYWNPMTPRNIVLCYWGFLAANDFSRQRVSAVIKHEFGHVLTGLLGLKHSEHR